MTTSLSLLAIETATSMCSVALATGGRIFERSQDGHNIHSQVVLEMVQAVLSDGGLIVKDLDAVAVDKGPGSFTGLRIGIGVAQGVAYGADCPMVGVSSLDTLAMQTINDGPVLAGIDARMGEVYWAEYKKESADIIRCGELQVSAPQNIATKLMAPVQLVGNAWYEYQDQLNESIKGINVAEAAILPSAVTLLHLAERAYLDGLTTNPADFAPEYVRNNVAKKSGTNLGNG